MEYIKDLLEKYLERNEILLKAETLYDTQLRLNSNIIEIRNALVILFGVSKPLNGGTTLNFDYWCELNNVGDDLFGYIYKGKFYKYEELYRLYEKDVNQSV